MDKQLQNYLNALADKYRAEPDLHEDICRKIQQRLASFMTAPGEYLHLEKAILSHVEETYKRLLMTKRNFSDAKKLLKESQQMSQLNVEKLLQIQASVNSLKSLLQQHKSNWGVLVVKKKGPAEENPLFGERVEAPESSENTPLPFPLGYCRN